MSWGRRPAGRMRSLCCLVVAAAFFLPAMPAEMGGPSPAGAESVWRTGSFLDFNASESSMANLALNGTGNDARLELSLGSDWVQVLGAGPPRRRSAAMSAIGNDGKVIMFGGDSSSEGLLGDTWIFDAAAKRWANMNPPAAPSARCGHIIAPVPNDDKVVLFGGDDGDPKERLNDTWIYDLSDNLWTQKNLTVGPSKRKWAAAAAADHDDRIVLFGGSNSSRLGDTWIYDTGDGQWTQIFPAVSPQARQAAGMAPVFGSDSAVLFGGLATDNGQLDDTWVFDFSQLSWHHMDPTDHPSARAGPGMATIANDDNVIVFGGRQGGYSETWAYDLSDDRWRLLAPSAQPPNRSEAAMANPAGSNRIILFGGYSGGDIQDTWIYYLSGYALSGSYTSGPFDTGGFSSYMWLNWTGHVPPQTGIRFQVRSGATRSNLSTARFIGPSGTEGDYYTENSTVYYQHSGQQWVQFRAFLNTSDMDFSPSLDEVRLVYNRFPFGPVPAWPADGSWINTSYPNFTWALNDTDSSVQGGFEWQLGPGSAPANLTSDEESSQDTYYVHGDPIAEGTWYWRVRTRDAEGDWGPFCAFQQVGIDVEPPRKFAPYAVPEGWTASRTNVWYSSSDNRSGIENFTVWIDGKLQGARDSPFPVPEDLPDGIHNILVRAYDRAGNYAEGKTRIYIDRTPPEPFTASAPLCWTRADPVVGFETADRTSGIDRYEIKVDAGVFTQQKSPATLGGLEDGAHDVLVRAYDRAGNFREANLTVLRDRHGPVDIQLATSPSVWTAADPIVSFSASDETSEIDRFEAAIDGGPFRAQSSPFTVSNLSDGVHSLAVRAYDLAGNYAEGTGRLFIDRTPPDPFTPAVAPPGWTRADPVVTFGTSDEFSGVRAYYLRVDEDLFSRAKSPYALPVLPDGRHNVTVRAVDNAGNTIDGSVEVLIDREAPVGVKVIINGAGFSTGGRLARLTISAQDTCSGPAWMCFSPDGAFFSEWEPFTTSRNWTLSAGAGEKTVYVKVRDAAGNEARAASATIEYRPAAAGFQAPVPLVIAAGILLATAVGLAIWRHLHGRAPPAVPEKTAAGAPTGPSKAPKGLK